MGPAELQVYIDGYQRRINREAWLYGVYVQDALAAVLSAAFAKKSSMNTFQYPNQPHKSLQPETEAEKQKEAEEERKKAIAYFNSFAKHKKKLEIQDPEKADRLKARLYMHQMMWAYRKQGNKN